MIVGQDDFKRMLFGDGKGVSVRFAKIADGYVDGRPTLVFDGESVATVKRYPYLSGYIPVAGDRVQVIDGVIQGKIM